MTDEPTIRCACGVPMFLDGDDGRWRCNHDCDDAEPRKDDLAAWTAWAQAVDQELHQQLAREAHEEEPMD